MSHTYHIRPMRPADPGWHGVPWWLVIEQEQGRVLSAFLNPQDALCFANRICQARFNGDTRHPMAIMYSMKELRAYTRN